MHCLEVWFKNNSQFYSVKLANNQRITVDVRGLFRFFPPPPALLTKLLFPLADMLSWAVWFKFLLNKVIANTCLFILTSFSKQSASWKVLEICELCALSTDSRKTYSVNKYMYTGSSSYGFDWGGGGGNNPLGGGGGERNGKDPTCVFNQQNEQCDQVSRNWVGTLWQVPYGSMFMAAAMCTRLLSASDFEFHIDFFCVGYFPFFNYRTFLVKETKNPNGNRSVCCFEDVLQVQSLKLYEINRLILQ